MAVNGDVDLFSHRFTSITERPPHFADLFAVQRQTDARIVFGHSYGGLVALEAARRTDGLSDVLVYEPGVLVLPHGGVLELELINDDKNTHCAVLPSNGDTQFIWLVNHSRGTATLELDGPGYYWYGSTTGNDEGRGLTGAIVVGGEVPSEARLDRPPQPRP